MPRSILVITILALSTSAALAGHGPQHRRAMGAYARVGAPPVVWPGGVSSSDHALHIRNLRDSGYDPKKNFNRYGNVASE